MPCDVHVDHLYLALTHAATTTPASDAELPFTWYTADQLDALDMFSDTRARAAYLLDRIDALAAVTAYNRIPG